MSEADPVAQLRLSSGTTGLCDRPFWVAANFPAILVELEFFRLSAMAPN
jgi:hypothetical protein